jgi:hypothetical protein
MVQNTQTNLTGCASLISGSRILMSSSGPTLNSNIRLLFLFQLITVRNPMPFLLAIEALHVLVVAIVPLLVPELILVLITTLVAAISSPVTNLATIITLSLETASK